MNRKCYSFVFGRILFAMIMCCPAALAAPPSTAPTVRVAVIGGMNETGFWQAIAERFEKSSGIHVQTMATGPKDGISKVFKQGGIDLITMHASDTIINLCADGWAMD